MSFLGKSTRRVGRFFGRGEDDFPSVDVSEKDGVRSLHLGSPTVQSSMRLSAPYQLELAYSRGMMAFLLFTSTAKNVLIIGLGGGSIPKFIYHYLPPIRVTAVELNPAVIAAARNYFMLPPDDERLTVIEGDGAKYLAEHPNSADVLMMDAFDGKGVVPDLCSQEFYDRAHDALTFDGILIVNLWGSDKNFDVYLQRIERSFEGRVLVLPTGRPGNILVYAFRRYNGVVSWKPIFERAKQLEETSGMEFMEFAKRFSQNGLRSYIDE